jgi:DNA-binding transcriptional ArsR family regulator
MAHPLRGRVLAAVADPAGKTVREIADMIGESRRRVRYHVDALLHQGLLGIAEKRKRRGAVEICYRAERLPALSTSQWLTIPAAQSRKVSLQILRLTMADAATAVAAGTFGIEPGHFEVRIARELDAQGLEELRDVFDVTLDKMQPVLAAGAKRVAASDEPPRNVVAALLIFELPSSSQQSLE